MKIHTVILLIAMSVGSFLQAQKLEYSYFEASCEGLKEYLLNHGDYFNGGNAKNQFFQGKYNNNYLKFIDNGLKNAVFDVSSSSEFSELIKEIQIKAKFKYKYCSSYQLPVVYNYVTNNGNVIRYSKEKQQIRVEYKSELTAFIKENEGLTTVFICNSDEAYAYHTNLKCEGLNNCKSEIAKTTFNDAKNNMYRICKICIDDSITISNPQNNTKIDGHNYLLKQQGSDLSKEQIAIIAQHENLENRPITKVAQQVIAKAKKKFNDYLQKQTYYDETFSLHEMKVVTGDFTQDGLEDVVIWRSWQRNGNYVSGTSEATFYKTEDNDAVYAGGVVSWETISSPEIFKFTIDKIKNGLMYLTEINYDSDDPKCCPSIKKIVILKHVEVHTSYGVNYGVNRY